MNTLKKIVNFLLIVLDYKTCTSLLQSEIDYKTSYKCLWMLYDYQIFMDLLIVHTF
jgi:hypothetical protein